MRPDDHGRTGSTAIRAALALVALIGGLGGLAGLYFVPIPAGNREPLLLALGLVLGWGSTVIGYEFGSSPAARRAASEDEVGVLRNTLAKPSSRACASANDVSAPNSERLMTRPAPQAIAYCASLVLY